MTQSRTMRWLPWVALGILAAIVFSFGIWSYPITEKDEALYSSISKELLEHSDWWTLYRQGKPWFIHAPMAMWIQAAVFKSFGVSELTARLPAVAFGTGLVLLTAAFGSLLFRRRVGIIAGLTLISSPLFYLIARQAILDMPFAFFVTLAIYLGVRAWKTGNRWLYPAFWFAAGLATLTKGLWGLALTLMVMFLYAVTSSERRKLLDIRLYASALVWAALVMPWLLINAQRWGNDFLEPVLMTNTYQRMTESICDHTGPWYYYIPILIGGLFPWSFLGIKAWFGRKGDGERLLLLWIIPAFLLHSAAATKLPNYMLPLFPALALLLAVYFSELKRGLLHGIVMLLLAVGAAAGIEYGVRFGEVPVNPVPLALCVGLAYAIAGIAFIAFRAWGVPVAAVCMAATLTVLPAVFPAVAEDLFPRQIALEARRIAGTETVLCVSDLDGLDAEGEHVLYFYAGPPFQAAKNTADLMRLLAERRDSILVVSSEQEHRLREQGVNGRVLTRQGKWAILRVSGPAGAGPD